jgi:hypothetical protein
LAVYGVGGTEKELTIYPEAPAEAIGLPDLGYRKLWLLPPWEEAAVSVLLLLLHPGQLSRSSDTAAPLRTRSTVVEAALRRLPGCRCGWALDCWVWEGGLEVWARDSREGSWTWRRSVGG